MDPERKEENKSRMVFLEFENNKIPAFKEQRGKDYILYGENNDYPDYLIDLFLRSAKNNAIITGKVNYIVGKGWGYSGPGVLTEDVAVQEAFLLKTNKYGQTLNDLTRLATTDFEVFNGFAFEIIWAMGKKSFEIFHLPFNKIRTNADESKYFYSDNWTDRDPADKKWNYKELSKFNPDKPKGSQIYICIQKMPRKAGEPNVYPIPEYIGGVPVIETDIEIANFHLNNIRTGFAAGTMVNLYDGVPPEDEAKKLEKKFKEKFTGTDRAGSLILNFANGKERGAEVIHLQPSDMDKQYIELEKHVQQEVFTAHKVCSPMLFGVKTEGQLGGRTELIEAYELFQNTYITQRQRSLEIAINELAAARGLNKGFYLKQTEPIGFQFSEETIVQSLPPAAIRDIVANKFGIDLSKYENATVTTTTQTEMRKFSSDEDKKLLQVFKKFGVSKKDYELITSRQFSFNGNVAESENSLLMAAFAETISTKPRERAIIDILNRDPLADAASIAKALGIEEKEASKLLKSIETKGLIEVSEEEGIISRVPNSKGLDVIKNNPPKTADISLMYSYEWRRGFNDSDAKTSREFCKELMELDRLYTRSEIQQISDEVGYNVWEHRGGFYRKPGTDTTLPYCRHQWEQHVVTRKS